MLTILIFGIFFEYIIKNRGNMMSLGTNKNLIFVLLLFLLGFSSCTLVENPDEKLKEENHYYETKEVADILNGTCAASGCHGGISPVNGFSTEIQHETMVGASNRPMAGVSNYGGDNVIPFNVEKSLLLQFVTGNLVNKLSYNHSILNQNQITTIANWIANGTEKAGTLTTRDGGDIRFGNDPTIIPGGEDTYASYGIPWANLSNTPFRLYKHWVHEGGIATPFIVHWPARIKDRGEHLSNGLLNYTVHHGGDA